MKHRTVGRRAGWLVGSALLLTGCADVRRVIIVTEPADATIRIEGVDRGVGPVRNSFQFTDPTQSYTVVASRFGFESATAPVTLDTDNGTMTLTLEPKTRPIVVQIEPADAALTLDGRPVGEGLSTQFRFALPFKVDPTGRSAPATLRAQRIGFAPAERSINWTDNDSSYTLTLQPLTKDLLLDTNPTGAELMLDGQRVGVAPVRLPAEAFGYDAENESFIARKLTATKTGYRPTDVDLSWDEGKVDYSVALQIYSKPVRIRTLPADATLKLDGKPLPAADDGVRDLKLEFPPLDAKGNLQEYKLDVMLNRPGEIWQPASATLAWDNGQEDYEIGLDEILLRPVGQGVLSFGFKNGTWAASTATRPTMGFKDITDGHLGTPVRITDLPAGTALDTFAISPDGKFIVMSTLEPNRDNRAKAKLLMARTDGVGGVTSLTDGRHLDITPSFSPAGDRILFSSDRGGGPLHVWSIPIDGMGGTTRLTAGNADNLWPTLDSSPKPRVFFQALIPGQPDPRVYSTQVGTVFETDLTKDGGGQPRLSPRDDAVVYALSNAQTEKTDIMVISDQGGVATKLTDTPDVAERDPAFSTDGTRVVFTSDTALDNGTPQSDIFMVASTGGTPLNITLNPALDDRPVFDPVRDAVYFRSNRGGKWDVWRIDVK
jgi:hypothetical protein